MVRSFKKEKTHKYIMMNRKTLVGVSSLVVLGAVVLAQGTTTLGDVRKAVQQNPHEWYVVVGANAKASDVIGAADLIAALQYYTVEKTVQPLDLSAVKVVLERPIVNATSILSGSFAANEVWNGSVIVNNTEIKYSVDVTAPAVSISLNESDKLQVKNAGFTVTLSFNDTIDKLNETSINVFGKKYYLEIYNDSLIYLRKVPKEEFKIYLNQEATYLGKTIKLVDVYETAENEVIAVLNVGGEEVEIPVGESKEVAGLDIYIKDARRSWVDPSKTYVEIGVGGGQSYKLENGKVYDPQGNEIGTWSLNGNDLVLTFTKDYLFAGDSYELPIFGGYKIVFKSYSLPPEASTLVEVKYAGSFTENDITYKEFTVTFNDAASGEQVTLPIYYNESSGAWAIGEKGATTINTLVFNSSATTPVNVTTSPAYYLLTDGSSVSRLIKVEVDNPADVSVAQITDLLTGKTYTLDPTYNPSVKLKLGDNEVEFKLVETAYGTYVLNVFNVSAGTGINFYAKDKKKISIDNNIVSIDGYKVELNATNEEIVPPTENYVITQEGGSLYKAYFNTTTYDYIKYPLKIKTDDISFYLATSDTPAPEVKVIDELHSTNETYEVSPGGSVEIGNETITVEKLEGVPNETESVKIGEPLIGYAILDTEVTPNMDHLFVVGGPAVNRIAAELLGVPYPTYGSTLKKMGILSEGEGIIKVFEQPRFAVLVAGWEAENTRAAARVLALFLKGEYNELANKTEVKVTGGLKTPQII